MRAKQLGRVKNYYEMVENQGNLTAPSFRARLSSFAKAISEYEIRLLLGFFALSVVMPFGLLLSWLDDPLGLKRCRRGSYWRSRKAPPPTLDDARRQF